METKSPKTLDVNACRGRFPGLAREIDGRPAVFLDGPAGSQVPDTVIRAMTDYLGGSNANAGGVFATSLETEELMSRGLRAATDFFGGDDPDLVTFGPSMTALTFAASRALSRTWKPGDEVIVSQLDHDANVTPWVIAANDAGATIRQIALRPDDCTLDLDDYRSKLSDRTKLVAVGAASNAVGTVNPVREIADLAHGVGARVFVDAVHSAPHLPIDVTAWDCDFVACSPYKFFGPHMGMLWGRRELLETLPVDKLRPSTDTLPGRWSRGTDSFEGIAGTMAAIDYIADLGRDDGASGAAGRRAALTAAFDRIAAYENPLSRRLLDGLAAMKSYKVWGIVDPARMAERVPTTSFTHARREPREIAEHLASRGIFSWHGNYYAVAVTEALGLEPGGMLRIGLLHYNTPEEVDRLLAALKEID